MAPSFVPKFAERAASRALLTIISIYPVLLLSVRNGMSVCLVLLSLLCLVRLAQKRDFLRNELDGHDIAFSAAMASLMGATLISQLFNMNFRFGELDNPSRFLLAVPVFLWLRRASLPLAILLEYSLPIGVLAGFLTSLFFPPVYWSIQGTYFVDPAQFAGAMLVLGFLSAATINWSRKDPLTVVTLKVLGLIIGVYCAIHSGERGVWVAIPILFCIWGRYGLTLKFGSVRTAAMITAAIGVLAAASYWVLPGVQSRVGSTWHEITSVRHGKLDTPVGQRLQMWRAGVEIVRNNAVFGVGPAGLADQLRALSGKGWLTPIGLAAALSQMHNEILAQTIRLGVFGLLSILAIYFIPLILFLRAPSPKDRARQMAAGMGVLFVTGYFIFGLTIETFNIKMFASFYAMTIALLLALALPARKAGNTYNNSTIEIADDSVY